MARTVRILVMARSEVIGLEASPASLPNTNSALSGMNRWVASRSNAGLGGYADDLRVIHAAGHGPSRGVRALS